MHKLGGFRFPDNISKHIFLSKLNVLSARTLQCFLHNIFKQLKTKQKNKNITIKKTNLIKEGGMFGNSRVNKFLVTFTSAK